MKQRIDKWTTDPHCLVPEAFQVSSQGLDKRHHRRLFDEAEGSTDMRVEQNMLEALDSPPWELDLSSNIIRVPEARRDFIAEQTPSQIVVSGRNVLLSGSLLTRCVRLRHQESTVDDYAEVVRDGPDLQHALDDLHGVIDEARDDGYVLPPRSLVDQAEQVLRFMYEQHPLRYEAYPMPDGSITVEGAWPTNLARSISVNLEIEGGALCFFDTDDGHSRRTYYDCADDLVNKCCLREALQDLPPNHT